MAIRSTGERVGADRASADEADPVPTVSRRLKVGSELEQPLSTLAEAGDDSELQGRSTLGDYRVVAKLGEGGMAQVYLAVKKGMSGFRKLLVLKILRKTLADDPGLVELFLNEARVSARLNHRNVVQTYEVGVADGCHVIVMEYLEGRSLAELRKHARRSGEKLPLRLHLSMIVEALAGLTYAHELADYDGTPLNLVHKDFTPNNLFVTYDGQVKVLDFGIAKAGKNRGHTGTATLRGTLRYIAPELILGESVDQRSDIYSAAVCLWEAATGIAMWNGLDDVTVMHRVAAGEAPSPRSVDAEVPEALDRICRTALSHDPEDRYASVRDLQRDLDELLKTLPGGRASAAEVGDYLEKRFHDDRVRLRRTIESQLERIEKRADDEVERSGAVPVISLDQSSSTGSASRPMRPKSGARRWGWLIAIPLVAAVALFAAFGLSGGGRAASGGPEEQPITTPVVATTPAPVIEPAPPPVVELAPPVVEEPPPPITIRASVTPRSARLFLGDQLLDGNPVELTVPREDAHRTLRAEAPGYVTEVVEIDLASDAHVALALRRAARGGRGSQGSQGSQGGSSTTTESAAGASTATPRGASIDHDNPWAE
jgi:serine/threonine protein kinase